MFQTKLLGKLVFDSSRFVRKKVQRLFFEFKENFKEILHIIIDSSYKVLQLQQVKSV
jgi:hypothetical protein